MKTKNQQKNKNLLDQILVDRNLRIGIARQSHQWFFNIYFSHYIFYKAAPFHKQMFQLTENQDIKNLVMIAFRGSAKTSIMTVSYPIWAIISGQQKKYVILIGQTQRQAKQLLSNIKKELENNEILLSDMGPFEENQDEWGSYSLVLPWYDARITAVSMEQTIRGMRHKQYRPDLIICDDIEDLNSVRTKEYRDKIYNWITGEVMPAGDQKTRCIFIGNLLHEDCLLMRLKEKIKNNELAGIFKKIPLVDDQKNIAWLGKYPTMKHIEEEKRKIGNEIAYAREFMLRIISDQGKVIYREWIKYYDVIPPTKNNNLRYTALGIDPAISKEDTASYTAMIAAYIYGYENELRIYILPNPVNERLDGPQQLQRAKDLSTTLSRGGRAILYVEDVALQRFLIDTLKNDGYYAEGVPVHGSDKRARLAIISSLIKNGTILFPKKGTELLINQLVNFGIERHNDLADALSVLVLGIIRGNNTKPFAGVMVFNHSTGKFISSYFTDD